MAPPRRRVVLLAVALAAMAGTGWATRYRFVADPTSFIEYTARHPAETWTGRAGFEALSVLVDDADPSRLRVTLSLDPNGFDSGNFLRDVNGRRTVFESARYPRISFVSGQARGAAGPAPAEGTLDLVLSGTLTMHGVGREIDVPVQVTRRQERVEATGSFHVLLSDHAMARPTLFFLRAEDEVQLRFVVTGRLEPVVE